MATHGVPARLILCCAASAFLLLAVGCGLLDSNGREDSKPKQVILFDDIDEVVLEDDAARIDDARLDGNLLEMRVLFYGGCCEHRFDLFGWLGWEKSNPPGGYLFLSHDAQGDSCTDSIHEQLAFDLSLLTSAWKENFQYTGPVRIGIREPGGTDEVVRITAEIR